MSECTWDPACIHHQWDLDLAPALAIDSGDVVHYDIPMCGEGQVPFGGSYADCAFDFEQGTILWLPVLVPGAHFSVGDPHACQGDGEVSVAALECPMRAALRFTLEKRTIPCPQWRSPGALTPRTDAGGYHGTMGIADDLMEGARRAVRAMIGWVCGTSR